MLVGRLSIRLPVIVNHMYTNDSLSSKYQCVPLHCEDLLNSLSLKHVQIDVIKLLKSQGFLLVIRFNLHPEAYKPWWSDFPSLIGLLVLSQNLDYFRSSLRRGIPKEERYANDESETLRYQLDWALLF